MIRVGSFRKYIVALVVACIVVVFLWSASGLHKKDDSAPCPTPLVSQQQYDNVLKKLKTAEESLLECEEQPKESPKSVEASPPTPPTPPPTPPPQISPPQTPPPSPPPKANTQSEIVDAVDLATCYAPLRERKTPVVVPPDLSVIHIVSHSHWDREWYLPLEQYRRRLVHSFDNMLNAFSNPDVNFVHYHADGQSVMLEDYLRVRPQNRAKLMQAVASDKLSAGPWYTQPDEFLASGEALIRNVQLGMRAACEYGAVPMQVAYMPDTFGHSGQLPQIFNGFDIYDCVLARGINGPSKSELTWSGVDGSSLFCVYLSKWYCNAMDVGKSGASYVISRWEDIKGYSSTRHSLLMNGCDQTGFDVNIPQVVRDANQQLQQNSAVVIQSSIETYVRTVKQELKGRTSITIGPELRAGDDVNVGLVNVLSNKMSQKKANWLTQTIMERWAEPFSALASVVDRPTPRFGFKYDSDAMALAWKFLIKNHAHDSIYGCSASEVHDDVDMRFRRARQVGETLASEGLAVLIQYIHTNDATKPTVVVYNPSNAPQSDQMVFVEVDTPSEWASVRVLDSNQKPVPSWTLEKSKDTVFDYMLPHTGLREAHRVARRMVVGIAGSVVGVGYSAYSIIKSDSGPEPSTDKGEAILANKHIKATVHKDGTITITNIASGITVGPLNKLEDAEDGGHSYMAQLKGIKVADESTTKVNNAFATPIATYCEVEIKLHSDFVIKMVYVLGLESKRVDVFLTFDNHHPNHMLRTKVITPAGELSVDCPFEVINRGHIGFAPVTNFVSTASNGGTLTVGLRGITEYRKQSDGGLYLSLLRSIREMGDWGEFETPSGQDFGNHLIEYSLIVTKDKFEGHTHARSFANPMAALQLKRYPRQGPYSKSLVSISRNTELRVFSQWLSKQTFFPSFNTKANWNGANYWEFPPIDVLPSKHTFVTVEPHDQVVLSSIKQADDRDGFLVRFYNPYEDQVTATVTVDFKVASVKSAYLCKFNEARTGSLELKANSISTIVGPRKVVTVEFVVG